MIGLFYIKKDDEFINVLTKVDILVVFGIGGYEISKEPLESKTLVQSIKKIISKFKPEIIIIEIVNRYFPILEDIEKFTSYYSYKTKHILKIKSLKDYNWLEDRVLMIIRKIEFYRSN